ncbi:restriction endonuclease PLD domain-containing protein [Siphonobacter sp. SORGH_AS_1065]|uniref:restriction endonuclease PLD domain-containing protein n=1 Tax=Siphonobacter sp. SORGH_AS_1065 TaxID=3041795 RepID=UPI0027806B28|nr:restriction endonuclease PLD domain-containing protein [Siphonobacter sp. SORGH_AS_1065]MDQ1085630.1 hypothetical protein [Siphonobacter sp. SORGH_AS_1065]
MSLIFENLFERALIDPIRAGANQLYIVSGYATATMVTRHLEYTRSSLRKDIAIKLIVGMCPKDGIQKSQHLGFQKLESGAFNNDFECNYIFNRPAVHSKVYAWLKDGVPIQGWVGSANYTQNAFSTSQREVLSEEGASTCLEYYNSLIGQTINCRSGEVPNVINIFDEIQTIKSTVSPGSLINTGSDKKESITLSFLDRSGNLPTRSGLNWGQRPEYGREPNQAYIRVPVDVQNSGFFPDRFEQFMVLTDDGKELICVRAQDNGKAIHTTLNNSLMGEYFRYRLGLPNGALVTRQDLLRYGRTDVDFYKIDDETYYMNFSVE